MSDGITISVIGRNAKVTVNGKKVVGTVPLHHNWRVIIGNNHVFRFVHPIEKNKRKLLKQNMRQIRKNEEERKEGEVGEGGEVGEVREGGEGGQENTEEINKEEEGKKSQQTNNNNNNEEFMEEENDTTYDYAFAMREINEQAMEALTSGERVARESAERESKEMEAKVRGLEIEMEHERKRAIKEASVQDLKFKKHQEKLEDELLKKENELRDATFIEGRGEEELNQIREEQARRRKDFEIKRDVLLETQKKAENELQILIERAQAQQREKEDERRKRRELDKKLIETIPLINEGNNESCSFGTLFSFEVFFFSFFSLFCVMSFFVVFFLI